jgi:hypothetical protein
MFDFVHWDSKSEMEEQLRRHGRALLIGNDAEAPRLFYTLVLAGDHPLMIGLCCSGLGIGPRVVTSRSRARLLVGHDCSLTCVDVPDGRIVITLRLDGAFYELIELAADNVAVIHELGAMKVNFDGAIGWMVSSPDVIKDFNIDRDVLKLVIEGMKAPLKVALSNGRQL